MSELFVAPDPRIEGVSMISQERDFPAPRIGVIGAIHGNEPAGLQALRYLEEQARQGELPLLRGTIVLIHGNPEATRRGARSVQTDLNRLFDYHFVDWIAPEEWLVEHHRAYALKPVLESLDAALDLHSATAPTPPFAIINRVQGARGIARTLGLEHVVVRWDGEGALVDKVTLAVLERTGRPGVSIECGQHQDPASAQRAREAALRFLGCCGALKHPAPVHDVELLHVYGRLQKPSECFRFSRPVQGMQPLRAGEVLGADDGAEVRIHQDCWAVMPNDQVPAGEDMLYLAHRLEKHY